MNNTVAIWRHAKDINKLLHKKGRVLVWTKIYTPPEGFEQSGSYVVGLIQADSGQILPMQIVDCELHELHEGVEVIFVVRRLGDITKDGVITYGLKAKLYEK